MKDFKKILATVMALATLGCVSAIPTDALVSDNSLKNTLGDSVTVGNSGDTGIRGDVNRDGKVTTADLLLLKKYLLGITTYGNDYKFDYVQKYDYRVDRSTFETVCTENGVDIKNVIYNEVEKTATFTFGNGSTLVVPVNFSNLILSSKVQNPRKEAVIYTNDEGKTVDTSNQCYYILGYTVSCANVHEFTGNIEDENEYIYDGTHSSQYTKHKPLGDSVALPDGTVLNCEGLRRDVEIVYDLNGKYMGFRVPRSGGEDGMFSDIYIIPSNSNVVIGSSESISVSGDVNDDGKATTIDLLLLKKYLLGITTW